MHAPQDKEQLDRYKDLSVGEILRRARIKQDASVEELGRDLNIRPELLMALEANDYERLPGKVYVVGFVRTYAEALGLDGDKVAYLLKSQSVGHDYKTLRDMPKPMYESRMPNVIVIVVSIGIFIVLLILWASLSGDGNPPEIPPVMDDGSL